MSATDPIALGGGRGVEQDRVGEHRAEQHRRGRSRRLHAVLAEALDDQGGGRADRVEGGRDRDVGLDRADVMVVEDLDDLGLLDPGHALSLLGVIDEDHAAGCGGDEVGAGYQPYRPA